MPAYRFCRSGDIPLLVEAHNTCFAPHFPDVAPMTVDDFKRDVREIDLWASSCVVVSAAKEPIGVLLAAKRESANHILRIGVRPGHQGQGHGRHMLESLSQKLAILGPRRMVAEVREDWRTGGRFLEACGYRVERSYVDFELEPRQDPVAAFPPGLAELIVPVTIDDLRAADVFDTQAQRCWHRMPEALFKHRERLRGIAVAAGDRFGAWLLVDDRAASPVREIMALWSADADPGRAGVLLGALVASFVGSDSRPVRIRKAHAGEIDLAWLARQRFVPGGGSTGYALEAGA